VHRAAEILELECTAKTFIQRRRRYYCHRGNWTGIALPGTQLDHSLSCHSGGLLPGHGRSCSRRTGPICFRLLPWHPSTGLRGERRRLL